MLTKSRWTGSLRVPDIGPVARQRDSGKREGFGMWVFVGLLLALVSGPVRADDATAAFPKFCEEWMQKLAAREAYNLAHIHWEKSGAGVTGTYVGYGKEYACSTKIGSQAVPIGRIVYRELVYAKEGPTQVEAEHSEPHTIETTEITEIFRYGAGKWIY